MVPKRCRKHSSKATRHSHAFFLKKVNEDLGIGLRFEMVSLRSQLRAELTIVINLSIENDGDSAVLVGNWLASTGQVNNAQASMTKSAAVCRIDPSRQFVRTAITDGSNHPVKKLFFLVYGRLRIYESGDSTHQIKYFRS